MSLVARQKAARCFALAASTTFPAERETAIDRGTAICAEAGLDLDDFDIPGRVRPPRPAGPSDEFLNRQWTQREKAREDIAEQMRRYREESVRQSRLADAMRGLSTEEVCEALEIYKTLKGRRSERAETASPCPKCGALREYRLGFAHCKFCG